MRLFLSMAAGFMFIVTGASAVPPSNTVYRTVQIDTNGTLVGAATNLAAANGIATTGSVASAMATGQAAQVSANAAMVTGQVAMATGLAAQVSADAAMYTGQTAQASANAAMATGAAARVVADSKQDRVFLYTETSVFSFDQMGTIGSCSYTGSVLRIPRMINGIPVTTIELNFMGSLYTNLTLTTVYVPDTVTSIGNNAFEHCLNLTAVYFEGDAPAIGDYVFEFNPTTNYFRSGASGFGTSYGGCPTAIWGPRVTGAVIVNGVTNAPDQYGNVNLTIP